MILDKFIEIHSELQYCILTMDVGSQEDRTKFSKLYFQLYSLFLISDKLEKYCNNLSELQEMLEQYQEHTLQQRGARTE